MNSIQPAFNESSSASEAARRIDTTAWALFFIWVGIAMLMEVPWGWFLVGVGVLTLAAQLFHWQIDKKIASGPPVAWCFSQGAYGCFYRYSGR